MREGGNEGGVHSLINKHQGAFFAFTFSPRRCSKSAGFSPTPGVLQGGR